MQYLINPVRTFFYFVLIKIGEASFREEYLDRNIKAWKNGGLFRILGNVAGPNKKAIPHGDREILI